MKRTPVALSCAAMAVMVASSGAAFAAATPAPMASPTTVPTAQPMQSSTRPASVPATLSLSQAEQIALASSPLLALARGVVNQEQAGIGIARSGYLPQLSADATTRRGEEQINITNQKGQSISQPAISTSNTASATLNQLILDGGRINAEVQAARYSTDSAKLTLLRDIQTVLLTVAQDYYASLQARHQLQAAQQSLSVAQVQERLVEAQYHAGVASKADVLTAQLPVAQAELAVASAQNGEATNVASLLTAMGLEATTPISLQDDTSVTASNPNVNEILSSALAERTDLSAAKASVNSAQASVRAAKLQWFPVIQGTATSGTGSSGFVAANYAANWSLQAGLAFPIYTGGLIKSEVEQASAFESQAEANYQSARLNVYENVQQSYLGLQTAGSSLNAAKVALDQARVVLNVTNAQYKAGVTTLPLLLNAQSQLTTAQSNYVQALYSYKVAQQNLLYAEGTLGPS
jgi:outer membrane protein